MKNKKVEKNEDVVAVHQAPVAAKPLGKSAPAVSTEKKAKPVPVAKAVKVAPVAGGVKVAPVAKSTPVAKVAKPAPVAGDVKATELGKEAKVVKKQKPKVVRDSFTMPQSEYQKIADIKALCLKSGVQVKKSEVLRAGVIALCAMDEAQLVSAMGALDKIKTGRPNKH